METQRLMMRPFALGDEEAVYEYLSDPEVIHFEPYGVQTFEQVKKIVAERMEDAAFWAVCLADTKKLIGNIYLKETEPLLWEVGYVFNRHYQGKGYATEAVTGLLQEVFSTQKGHRVTAYVNPENEASWRLLERLGFTREAHLRKNVAFEKGSDGLPRWQDTYIYGLLAADEKCW